jgi:hypothetical protein
MNPLCTIRESLRITLHSGSMWILIFLLYLVMIPAFILSGGFGAVTLYLMMPGMGLAVPDFLLPLQDLSAAGWAAYFLLSLVLLTFSSLLSWAIQAAMIRAADAAADGRRLSIRGAMRLGNRRWISLTKLAVTFGLIIQSAGIAPPLLALAAGENSTWGAALVQMAQTVLMPLSTILGILVFLLTMSVALEDVRPRIALRRIVRLIRAGWWGFLLAYILQGVLAVAVAMAFAAILAIAVFLLMLGILSDSMIESVLAGAVCVFAAPVGIGALTFVLVFSTVFFTLAYREAARMAAGEEPHPVGC